MDSSLNKTTLHSLAQAERERKEQYARQIDEARNILADFIQRVGQESGIPKPESVLAGLPLVEIARLAVNIANLIILRQRNELAVSGQTQEIVQLKQENSRIQSELDACKRTAVPAKSFLPEPVEAEGLTAEVASCSDCPAEGVISLSENSLENRILHVAGAIQTVRLSVLIDVCTERISVPRPQVEEGVQQLLAGKYLALIESKRLTQNGLAYPLVFGLTPQGLKSCGLKSNPSEVSTAGRLAEIGLLGLEEVPLLAYFVEEFLPRCGYLFRSYLPENLVPDREGTGSHLFAAHVLLDYAGRPVLFLCAGEGYAKGDIHPYLEDFNHVTDGDMHFLCLNGKTSRQLLSDMNFWTATRDLPNAKPRITNLDDLAMYEQRLQSGDIKPGTNNAGSGAAQKR